MDAIHAFAREGELDNLLKCIESGVSVNTRGLFLCGYVHYEFFLQVFHDINSMLNSYDNGC